MFWYVMLYDLVKYVLVCRVACCIHLLQEISSVVKREAACSFRFWYLSASFQNFMSHNTVSLFFTAKRLQILVRTKVTVKIRTALISLLPQLIIIYQNRKLFYIKYHRTVTLTTHKKNKTKNNFLFQFYQYVYLHTYKHNFNDKRTIGRYFSSSTLLWIRLTPYLLMWRIRWAPNNASKGQMGSNSAFKGLNRSKRLFSY